MSEQEKGPGRWYRVVERFPWIEGGKPGAQPGEWEGGQHVVYEPGDTVHIEDSDLRDGVPLYLEGIDDAGRAALEKAKKPARQIAVADLDPSTVEFLTRALEEKRRAVLEEGSIETTTWAVNRDGTRTVLSVKVHPANPAPGVVYDDHGLPLPYETAIRKRRHELERKAQQEEARAKGNARANARRTEMRDQNIAEFALATARVSDELADNPKQLNRHILTHWREEWGKPLASSTLARILKEKKIASRLRGL